MRTLFVSGVRPYPPRSGSPLRAWHNIRTLATAGPVSVFSFGDRFDDGGAMPDVERWEHISYDDYPEHALAGVARVRKLLRPRQYPLPNDDITAELNARLRAFMDATKPDVVVLSGWTEAMPDVLRAFPRTIVDTHNVESQLQEDLLRAGNATLGVSARMRIERFKRRERRMLARASRVWVCSRDDAALLERLDRHMSPPVIWPNVIDVDAYAQTRARTSAVPSDVPSGPPTIVYVGYYHYAPNRLAAEEMIERVFPRVLARLPHARLVLVGRQPSDTMRAAAARDARIVVTGGVDDARPYLRVADVAAVALRSGGGTRLKVLEAFAAGIPVVSTSKGVEGIDAVDGRHVIVADDLDRFADAVIDVLEHRENYRSQTEHALRLVRDAYSLETLRGLLPSSLPMPPMPAGAQCERAVYTAL